MAFESSIYSDRGYQAKPQDTSNQQSKVENIFNPKTIYGDISNPAYIPPSTSTPSSSRGGSSSATTGYSSYGGGSSSTPQTSTGGSGQSYQTPQNVFEQKAQGYTPENAITPQSVAPTYNFTAPRTVSSQETMQVQQQVSTNIQPIQTQTFAGSINARSAEDYSKPEARLPSYSEQFLYKGGQKAQDLQQGNQIQYGAGAVLGFGVGVGKFGRDIFYDFTGQGLKEIPGSRTAKGVFGFISDVPGTITSTVSELQKNPYETSGYILAPSILTGGAVDFLREGGVRLVSKEVSPTGILSEKGLGAVESGSKTYPAVNSINQLSQSFLKTETEGNIKLITASPTPISTDRLLGKTTTIGESRMGELNKESTGLYVSPYGEGNPAFLDIVKSDEIYGFSILGKTTTRPTLSIIDVSSEKFGRIPPNILKSGIESENIFLKSNPDKVFITGNVERAFNPSYPGRATIEFEAVITPGTELKSTGGIFGYTERVNVAGTSVPLRTYVIESSPISKNVGDLKNVYKVSKDDGFIYNPETKGYIYYDRRSLGLSDISGFSSFNSQSPYKENPSRFSSGGSSTSIAGSSGSSLTFGGSSGIISGGSSPSPIISGSSGGSLGGSSPSSIITPSRSISGGSSYISQPIYRYTPTPTQMQPPSLPFYRQDNKLVGKTFKFKKEKVYKPKSLKYEAYALPDLMSVSKTEGSLFSFGRKSDRAMTPKLTPKVQALSIKAFSGYSSGFVPTEQMRKKLKL